MRTIIATALLSAAALSAVGCATPPPAASSEEIGNEHSDIEHGSPEEAAVLALVNDPAITFTILDDEVGLDRRAAENIIARRDGADALAGTGDDDLFDTVAELDAVPYVGASALDALLAYAVAHGYLPGTDAPTEDELVYATLALANDRALGVPALDDAVGLDKRAAENIVSWRSGVDAVDGTADDRTFMTIGDLDDINYVADSALAKMRDYAVAHGYLELVPSGVTDVVFSPKAYSESHLSRVIERIDEAEVSLDIAMYSFSDNGVFNALEDAVARGVTVRFIFDTASEDRKETGSALASTRSAKLEAIGVDVRWVNKIMHHKLAIVDGPRTDLAAASTGWLISGSGNWSHSAGTRYDENTLFLKGETELMLRTQQEFNHLWDHARDFVFNTSLPVITATPIADTDIAEGASTDAFFTSDNFSVSGDTFRIVTGRDTIAPAMVAAIENATDSIWIASGHLRSRAISEALIAKAAAHPEMDIRVYTDGQEYISSWFHATQESDLAACVAAATTASQLRNCYDKGFLFGYQLGEAGVPVRYKYYAFRWDYTYADQMHHKLMIVDGDELWTGSYNQSDNAEHNTFENMMVFRGLPFGKLIGAYRDNFETLWNTERDTSTYADLLDTVATASTIPLVFEPMALDHAEIATLKDLIVDNCPDVYSDPFKDDPASHKVCFR